MESGRESLKSFESLDTTILDFYKVRDPLRFSDIPTKQQELETLMV